MKKPLVLVVIKTLGVGGAERLLASAAPFWSKSQNFSYRVLHLSAPADLAPDFERARIAATCAGFRGSFPTAAGWKRLREELSNADLVHAHLPLPGIFVRWARPTAPILYTEHTLRSCYHPLTRFFHVRGISSYAAVVAVSRAVENELRGEGRSRKILRIENAAGISGTAAVLAADLPVPAGAPVVLFLGRLEPDKDPLRAVRVFARAAARAPQAHLVFAGEGSLKETCRALAEKEGVGGRTHFLGLRSDVSALLARAEVLLNTSRIEGHPLSLLEAQAAGRAIVAPRLGGIPEIVEDGKSGRLCDGADEAACAAALAEVLEDKALRGRLEEGARAAAAARPTLLQWAEAHERLYASLLASDGLGRGSAT